MSLSNEDLQAIRERDEEATPGPWSDLDAQIRHTQIDGWTHPKERAAAQKQTAADMAFVRHAREDVPLLLDHNAELQARLDKVRELHKPVPIYTTEAGDCEHGGDCRAVELEDGSYCPVHTDGLTCNECAELAKWADDLPAYPCPTIQAIDGSDQ